MKTNDPHHWHMLAVAMAGSFMGALDIAVVSPAIHTIGRQLDVNGRMLSWIITFYLIVFLIASLVMSALSDRFSHARLYVACIAIFGIGSLWAGLSTSFWLLLAARGIQALGAGGLFPIANTMVGGTFPSQHRGMALGLLSSVWGVAAIVGPPLGGWLTELTNWRMIFFINLPIAATTLFYAYVRLPRTAASRRGAFDFPGIILLGAGVTSLAFGLNNIQSVNLMISFISPNVCLWLVAGAALLIGFIEYEPHAAAPVISISLFTRKGPVIGMFLSFIAGVTDSGLIYLPAFAATMFDIGAGTAGSLVLVTASTVALLTAPTGWLLDAIGVKPVLLAGTALTAVGAALIASADTIVSFIIYQIILGVGLASLVGAPIRYILFIETRPEQRAAGQALSSVVNSFGILVGSALTGAFLGSHSGNVIGYREAFIMISLACGVGVLFSLGLPRMKK